MGEAVFCGNCGERIAASASFCGYCGEKQPAPDAPAPIGIALAGPAVQPEPTIRLESAEPTVRMEPVEHFGPVAHQSPESADAVFCTNCGTGISVSARFCKDCGASQEIEQEGDTADEEATGIRTTSRPEELAPPAVGPVEVEADPNPDASRTAETAPRPLVSQLPPPGVPAAFRALAAGPPAPPADRRGRATQGGRGSLDRGGAAVGSGSRAQVRGLAGRNGGRAARDGTLHGAPTPAVSGARGSGRCGDVRMWPLRPYAHPRCAVLRRLWGSAVHQR
jgi:Double zinc ribbon